MCNLFCGNVPFCIHMYMYHYLPGMIFGVCISTKPLCVNMSRKSRQTPASRRKMACEVVVLKSRMRLSSLVSWFTVASSCQRERELLLISWWCHFYHLTSNIFLPISRTNLAILDHRNSNSRYPPQGESGPPSAEVTFGLRHSPPTPANRSTIVTVSSFHSC